jgi:hypothetical protein
VRVLCRGPLPALAVLDPVVAGEAGRLDPVLGPTRPTEARPVLCTRGQLVPMPRRRREVAALVGVGVGRLAAELWRGHRGVPRDLDAWGAERFGPSGWSGLVRPMIGSALGGEPGPLHRGLGPLLTCRPAGPWHAPTRGARETVARWVETVRAAGGEVLDDVHVSALEMEAGKVAAVMTDHGRERVARLVTDWAVPRTAALLPPDEASDSETSTLPHVDLVHVELLARNELPPLVISGGIATRIRRAVLDGGALSPDRVWVTLAGPALARELDETLGRRARDAVEAPIPSGVPGAIVRVEDGGPLPRPSTEGAVHRWLLRLATFGVWPVGPRALYVPLLTRDLVDTTVAVLDGVPPAAVRGGRLGLTPARPWVLAQ